MRLRAHLTQFWAFAKAEIVGRPLDYARDDLGGERSARHRGERVGIAEWRDRGCLRVILELTRFRG
jgi:hypothetical protein